MHIDPFEEIEMAEKSAEQHRRSAAEKEVKHSCRLLYTFLLACLTVTIMYSVLYL